MSGRVVSTGSWVIGFRYWVEDTTSLTPRNVRFTIVGNLGNEAVVPGNTELLHGTLELLILRVLRVSSLHGWGISKHIREVSRETLQINQGSLYPALYRLERQGMIRAEWGTSDEGRRAKFYTITRTGHAQLTAEETEWRRFALAIELVLTSA
jgi:PadR family transcriptional regulator